MFLKINGHVFSTSLYSPGIPLSTAALHKKRFYQSSQKKEKNLFSSNRPCLKERFTFITNSSRTSPFLQTFPFMGILLVFGRIAFLRAELVAWAVKGH